MFFSHLAHRAVARPLRRGELLDLVRVGIVRGRAVPEWLGAAHDLKERFFPGQLHLCAITSAKTGRCAEDCAFCAQSGHHAVDIASHPLEDETELERRGRLALESGLSRFSFVTSGGRLTKEGVARLARVTRRLTALGLAVDLSVGTMDAEDMAIFREAGVDRLHHNLETSPRFYPRICSTHSWRSRYDTVKAALKAHCKVCSGGIFGLGESWEDRVDLALALRSLGVDSIPLNFLTPIPGTPLAANRVLSEDEALAIIALFRFALPQANIRIAGGRLAVFGDSLHALLRSGASGLMVGDYLTTPGMSLNQVQTAATSVGLDLV